MLVRPGNPLSSPAVRKTRHRMMDGINTCPQRATG
jgi:hypothetical protein